jgi:hypothetical protein
MMNSSGISSSTNTSFSSNTVSPGQAPTSSAERVIGVNVSNRNEVGAGRLPVPSSAPFASTQVFKGKQRFMGSVENRNIDPDLVSSPQHPLQTFIGKQEFTKLVTNVNEAGPDRASQTKMQDIGDGIRVSVPLQHFDGDQIFRDGVKNTNTLNSNNHTYNSGNIGGIINGSPSVPDVPSLGDFDALDDVEVLQSFTGGQKFCKDVDNNNTINLKDSILSSGNIGSTTFVRVNGVDVSGQIPTAIPQQSGDVSWAKRVLRKNLLQRFHGKQEFMGNVTDRNTVN